MHSTNSEVSKALIAYVPALHAGYLKLFKQHSDATLYILGRTFIDAYPRLNRDIRALDPEEARTSLQALSINSRIEVLELSDLAPLDTHHTFILPDEDVSCDFSEKYLAGKNVELQNIFLRWDGVFSNTENEVPADRTISTSEIDNELIGRAIKEGERSADWWRQIGALLVIDSEVVAAAHIRYFPSDLALDIFGTPRTTVDFGERPDLYISMHAEADLIAQAAKEGLVLEGASLYTSTFPCVNCAFLIARAGIKKIYYSQGYSRLDADGILKNAGAELILVREA